MATESSAVVRFINLVQKEHQTLQDQPAPVIPDLTEDLEPVKRSMKVPAMVGGALLFAATAAVAGIYVGKHYQDHSATPAAAQATAAAPASSTAPATTPASPTPTPTPPPTPGATPAAAAVALPAAGRGAAPAPAATIDPAVAAQTGFDIRVKPSAVISLDGKVLGTAPLRVRNLTPGAHEVNIEAPTGYFSRRVEVNLAAGQPQNLDLSLDAVNGATAAGAPAAEPAASVPAVAALAPTPAAGDADDAEDPAPAEPAPASPGQHASRTQHHHAHHHASHHDSHHAEAAAHQALAGLTDDGDAAGKGTLMLGSKPPCDIYIDGHATGLKTPQRSIKLASGTYHVTLVNKTLNLKRRFKVKIATGKTTRAIQDLTGNL